MSCAQLWFLVSCLSELVWLTCAPIRGDLPSMSRLCQDQRILKRNPSERTNNRRLRRAMGKWEKKFRLSITARHNAAVRRQFRPTKGTKANKPTSNGIGWLHDTAQGWKDTGIPTMGLLEVALLVLAHCFGAHPRQSLLITSSWAVVPTVLVIIKHCVGVAKTNASTPHHSQSSSSAYSSSPANKGNRIDKRANDKLLRPRKRDNTAEPVPTHDINCQDTADVEGLLMACPFYKFDPKTHRGCAGLTLRNFSHVSQHLTRSPTHLLGTVYCPRCWKRWDPKKAESESLRDSHVNARGCVQKLGPERLYPSERTRLTKDVPRGASDEVKWFWVWKNFFPGHPRPRSAFTESAIHDTVDYFGEGSANLAFTEGLHAALGRVAERPVTTDTIMDLIQSSFNSLARPLRLWHGIQPDAALPDMLILPEMLSPPPPPAPLAVVQPPPISTVVGLEPPLVAEPYPTAFQAPASNTDWETIDAFLRDNTNGVFEQEEMDTEQRTSSTMS